MYRHMNRRFLNRQGTVAALMCFLMLPLLMLLALFVDYGFLLYVRTDLQRVADQAALAAVYEVTPSSNGSQDTQAVRAAVLEYVQQNLGNDFQVRNSDIEIGRYNPESIYSQVDILDDGIADTVRCTIRRKSSVNSPVTLYFARLFDNDFQDISATATAVMRRSNRLAAGARVLPFAVSEAQWEALEVGDQWSLYGDGKIKDGSGNSIPGNWATADLGPTSNSTAELSNQILNGLRQSDLNLLYQQGAIASPEYINAATPMSVNADPGFSAGIMEAVQQVHGQLRVIPIYSALSGGGNNLNYSIIGWGVVEVVGSTWNGSNNSSITVRRGYLYDGKMQANHDLSNQSDNIEGVFTSPVLVE